VPLVYGAGCQNKVLEAMACATPVVATPPAVAALAARPDRDVLVAEQPDAFADAVLALLGSARRRREVGDAGRRYVEAHHSWDEAASRLERIYESAIAARRQARPVAGVVGAVAASSNVAERLYAHRSAQ
jgi:glycosyltransferase involved in cell wall biosynthesis